MISSSLPVSLNQWWPVFLADMPEVMPCLPPWVLLGFPVPRGILDKVFTLGCQNGGRGPWTSGYSEWSRGRTLPQWMSLSQVNLPLSLQLPWWVRIQSSSFGGSCRPREGLMWLLVATPDISSCNTVLPPLCSLWPEACALCLHSGTSYYEVPRAHVPHTAVASATCGTSAVGWPHQLRWNRRVHKKDVNKYG